MPNIRILDAQQVLSLLTVEELIPVMEDAFAAFARGKASLFPVIREALGTGGIFGVKSGYLQGAGLVGYKSGGYWLSNRDLGLPNHQSIIVLHDAETGVPDCIVDGNTITTLRTGAANAVALKYLARPDSRILGIIGLGVQGRVQTQAALWVLKNIQVVKCYDLSPALFPAFSQEVRPKLGRDVDLQLVDCERVAVQGSDVVITATPSTSPHLLDQWVSAGTHVSAVGADTLGKQELETALVVRSELFCDVWSQCQLLGESQHAAKLGKLPAAELGGLVTGVHPGRSSPEAVTVFDATGMALQDLAAAHLAVRKAIERGVGSFINLSP